MFPSDFNPTFAYSTNESVTINGKNYTSLQNGNTGHAPDKTPAFWKLSEVVPANAKFPAGDPRNAGDHSNASDPRNVSGDPRNVSGDPRNVTGMNGPNYDVRLDPKNPGYDAKFAAKYPGGNPNVNLPSGVGNAHNAQINPSTQAGYGLDDRGVKHDPEARNTIAGTPGYDARFDSKSPHYDAAFSAKNPANQGNQFNQGNRGNQAGNFRDARFDPRHNPDGYAAPYSEPQPRREITEKEKADLEVRKAAYLKRFSEGS